MARNYYHTQKGKHAANIGKQFLSEWQKIKEAAIQAAAEDPDVDETLIQPMATIEFVDMIRVCFVLIFLTYSMFYIIFIQVTFICFLGDGNY